MMVGKYLFRAKIINKWESEDEFGPPNIVLPNKLPIKLGPFVLGLSPNSDAYFKQEFEGSDDVKINNNYPYSPLYFELRLEEDDKTDEVFKAEELFLEIETLLRLFRPGGIYIYLFTGFVLR